MKIIADLHIHSRFSRACSQDLNIPTIARFGKQKGLGLIGTGDCAHPQYFKELTNALTRENNGFYHYSEMVDPDDPLFVPTVELSCIYKKREKVRRIHLVVILPSLEAVHALATALTNKGCNLHSDGRPILGIDAKNLTRLILDLNPQSIVIPAHAWTPWFSIFGSKSGFNSIEECFEELTPEITAIETGLSSDPPMNRTLSSLDPIILVSNSDAHSSEKLLREGTIFELPSISYRHFYQAFKNPTDSCRVSSTIEFFPEEGKYHYDGHSECKVSLHPLKTKKLGGLCPACGRPLTIGVLHRVLDLADRPHPEHLPDYKRIVPLSEIIASSLGVGVNTKAVRQRKKKILEIGKNEINSLLRLELASLQDIVEHEIIQGIECVRNGSIHIVPGYDGVFGIVSVFPPTKIPAGGAQQSFEL